MRSHHLHRLRCAGVSLFTALILCAPSLAAAAPTPGSPAETSRFNESRKLYAADKYIPAAERFESLHADTQIPLYLYYAGLAREGAGQDALAIRHWQQALRLGLASEFTAKAQARLDQAKARTTALTITVTPAALAEGVTVEMRAATPPRHAIVLPLAEFPIYLEPGNWTATLTPKHPGFQPTELRVTIVRGSTTLEEQLKLKAIEHPTTFAFTPPDAPLTDLVLTLRDPDNLSPERREAVQAHQLTIPLRAGIWHYTLEMSGHPPQSGSLSVAPGAQPTTLVLPAAPTDLEPDPAPDPEPERPPKKPTRRLALGLGLGGLAPAIAGATLTGLAINANRKADFISPYYDGRDLLGADRMFTVGPLLIATAVGLWTGAIVSSRPARRKTWSAILASGAILGVAGVVWNGATFPQRNRAFSDEKLVNVSSDDWNSHKIHTAASSALIGLGAGLCISGVAALIAGRRSDHRKTSAQISSTLHQGGFMLQF